jgi:hypothetical protein
MLTRDIRGLLSDWQPYLDECALIFLQTGVYQRDVFFGVKGKDAIFQRKDPRLKTIPFPTRRPTLKEIARIYAKLSTVLIVETPSASSQPSEEAAAKPQAADGPDPETVDAAPGPLATVSVDSDYADDSLYMACKSGDLEEVRQILDGPDCDINYRFNQFGNTALHIASLQVTIGFLPF